MIAKMSKITLLCLDTDREDALERLRRIGVLHVSRGKPCDATDLQAARKEVDTAEGVLRALQTEEVAADSGTAAGQSARDIVSEAERLLEQRKTLSDTLQALKTEEVRIAPLGDFDPTVVQQLADSGVTVGVYEARRKRTIDIPEGATLVVLHEGAGTRVFAVASTRPVEIDAVRIPLPERSLTALRREIGAVTAEIADVDKAVAVLAGSADTVTEYVEDLRERVEYVETRETMAQRGRVTYLHGFCPADRVEDLRAAAREAGWAVVAKEPGELDAAPTLIRNPAWIRPIKAVFDVIGIIPGYREIDISAVFLLFFSVFFAILVGDAGYGLLFLLATGFARRKFKNAPAYPFHLMGILSVCTLVWGVLTGNYFGITGLPAPLEGCTVKWLTNESNVMILCFFIGALHLSMAHVWNAVRTINSTRALAQVGWTLLAWTMYFAACSVILDRPFPTIGFYLLWPGLALVVLFMTPPRAFKKEWHNHVMLPLDVISNFVDVVSYVRLFAVGAASLAVAMSFNEMALANGIHSVVSGLVAALILVFGHLLNILLALMGILVHGVRLNTLEFSGHIGMQWTGIRYRPFARRTKQTNES